MLKKVSGKKVNSGQMEEIYGGKLPIPVIPEPICLEFCNSRCGSGPDSYKGQAKGQDVYQA